MGQIKIIFMKKVVFFIPLALIIFTSCTFIVPYPIKRDFKYCFDAEKTGLDTLININGYYAPDTIIRPSNYIRYNGVLTLHKDTLSPAYVFYDNGFVFRTTAIDDFIENKKIILRGMVEPGGYVLHGDTIKFQFVNAPGGQSRELVEIWFKIIDRNTIQRLPVDNTLLQPSAERIYVFRPLETKVNPKETWIYNKSWFRCKKK
jgi:hypothetical protein